MNDIQAFTSPVFGEIRTYTENGCPFFCLADVCRILDLQQVSRVKDRLNKDGVTTSKVIDRLGRIQQATFINESNLYKLIFQSRKSEAEQFTDWVTGEVLPAIRKHGLYAVDDLIANPDLAIKAFEALKQERKARIELEQKNALLMHVNKTYTATEIAKELGFRSAIELNNELERRGIQYKVNHTWVPKADYADKGYFIIKQEALDNGKVIYTRRITQEGRIFLLGLFD
ncbi:MAG: phage antirepressor [Treponema sp.]